MSKRIVIIAGPNGAGKTTFARAFLPEEAQCPRFINAGLIAAGLSPFAPDAAAIKAGRLMLEEIAACVQHGESFAFETTLAGLGLSITRVGPIFGCAMTMQVPSHDSWSGEKTHETSGHNQNQQPSAA